MPFASIAVPGLGQYLQGGTMGGLGHTGTAVLAAVVATGGSPDPFPVSVSGFPRGADEQLRHQAAYVAVTTGMLSAWDSFQRSVPLLQAEGKYGFLPEDRASHLDLLAAPFDLRHLGRWTTWVHLGYTAAVAGLILDRRRSDIAYAPFRGHDAAFVTSLSMNAAVGEEALFRGWLLPVFTQSTGSFWGANALQAGLFGLGHVDAAEEFAAAIGAWALYEGWLTRRNDWSLGESIFHHFWYDVAVLAATLLRDERAHLGLSLPGFD